MYVPYILIGFKILNLTLCTAPKVFYTVRLTVYSYDGRQRPETFYCVYYQKYTMADSGRTIFIVFSIKSVPWYHGTLLIAFMFKSVP